MDLFENVSLGTCFNSSFAKQKANCCVVSKKALLMTYQILISILKTGCEFEEFSTILKKNVNRIHNQDSILSPQIPKQNKYCNKLSLICETMTFFKVHQSFLSNLYQKSFVMACYQKLLNFMGFHGRAFDFKCF